MNSLMRRVFSYLLIAVPIAFAAGQAHAGLTVTVAFNGGGAVTVVDNGAGDSNAAVGIVGATFSNGASSVLITAFSAAPDGFLVDTQLDANIAAGMFGTIIVQDDGYVTTSSPSIFSSGLTGVVVQSGLNVNVATQVNSTTVFSVNGLSGLTINQGSASIITGTAPATFTMTHTTTFNNTSSRGRTAAFTTATSIPEPSAVALLGMGIIGFGFARRRNRSV